jgi:hypothetical protein
MPPYPTPFACYIYCSTPKIELQEKVPQFDIFSYQIIKIKKALGLTKAFSFTNA